MFKRLSNSWNLVKASWAVLLADKELIIFPLLSGIASLIVIATFAVPMFVAGLFDEMFGGAGGVAQLASYILIFLFYLAQYFVILLSNTALVGAAMIRLEGGDPTVRDGLRIAWQHIGGIFVYAIISATVGLILRWLSERGILGRLASSIFGLAWGLATFLVIPVLVVEDVGPLDAIKRSTRMLKSTWGEQIAGNFSIGLVFTIFILLTIVTGVVVTVAINSLTGAIPLMIVSAVFFILIIIGLAFINTTLSGIYAAAVYRFAAGKEDDLFFNPELVQGAFRHK
jgi:hypothetical protein